MTHMLDRIVAARIARTKKSILLLGPRQVGKSTLTRSLRPDRVINLADEALFLEYAKDAGRLRREVSALKGRNNIVIDEVQRIPSLLNSVQAILDEGAAHRFILTGSSARKLKQKGVNLLPGRVILEHLDPLLFWELGEKFDLRRALRLGTLPGVYLDEESGADVLGTYATTYLREEIQQEAATKDIGGYARFLDAAAEASGAWINYSKLASDTEIPKETIRRFVSILEDTLLIFRVPPYSPKESHRRVSHRDRYVFFDLGVRNAILRLHKRRATPTELGALFEQWLILQCIGFARAHKQDWKWSAYRTEGGAEVDFILDVGNRLVAIECKWGTQVREKMLRGLRSFEEVAHLPVEKFVVYHGAARQRFAGGEIAVPYQEFLTDVLPGFLLSNL